MEDDVNTCSDWTIGLCIFTKSVKFVESCTWLSFMLYMERKYLPSLPDPCPMENSIPYYHSRFSENLKNVLFYETYKNPYLQEIWDLQLSDKITPEERLTMLSMMDGAYFHLENAVEVFKAWEKVASEMNDKSRRAFSLVIAYCNDFIAKTDLIDKIAVNWNSESMYTYLGRSNKDGLFDCYLAFQAIEDEI